MEASDLIEKHWYYVRREGGTMVPYRFHRISKNKRTRRMEAEFFVGSFICTFPLGRIVAKAEMPKGFEGAE